MIMMMMVITTPHTTIDQPAPQLEIYLLYIATTTYHYDHHPSSSSSIIHLVGIDYQGVAAPLPTPHADGRYIHDVAINYIPGDR